MAIETVGVVGAGYVGVPLAQTFADAGRNVLLVDVVPGIVEALNRGESHIEDVPSADLARLVRDSLALHAATEGAFDVRIGAAVRAAGYDRSFETMTAVLRSPALTFAPPVAALTIEVDGDEVRLGDHEAAVHRVNDSGTAGSLNATPPGPAAARASTPASSAMKP